jgi:hypothetical protein
MKNIMIDIETLGTKPNSVILSISAVGFDLNTGTTGSIFHQNIDINSCIKEGLNISPDTFFWWLNQNKEAQENLTDHTGDSLRSSLRRFAIFVNDCFPKDVNVWGNSARFDLGLLEAAYTACGYKIPWNYYNERDVRTLVSFKPEIKAQMLFEGTKHYGIDDCKHQIKYCYETWKYIQTKLNLSK